MQKRALLMFAPGHPFVFTDLMPQRRLAALAGALHAAGHEVVVADLGVARYAGGSGKRGPARLRSEDAYGADLMRLTQMASAFEVAVVLALDQKDLGVARLIGEDLGRIAPHCRRVLTGPLTEPFADLLTSDNLPFDDFLGDSAEWELPRMLASQSHSATATRSLDTLPLPLYDRLHYPALHAPGKLLVFELEHGRGALPQGAGPAEPWRGPTQRVRAASRLAAEWAHITENFPALRGVRIGGCVEGTHAVAAGYELRGHKGPLMTTRELAIECATDDVLASLVQDGCRTVHFRVDSGSQRMLDHVHEHSFVVSQAERVLRTARQMGMRTSVSLTYPTPRDDYHTRAESIRILTRTRPDVVQLHAAFPCPGSRWWTSPETYGWLPEERRLLEWSLNFDRDADSFPALDGLRKDHAAERRLLQEDITALKDVQVGTPDGFLLQSLIGESKRARQQVRRLQRSLECGNPTRAGTLIEAFNRQMARQGQSLTLQPFVPILAAVGN
jgi:hypothetical protein